jgi:hypothetical protein
MVVVPDGVRAGGTIGNRRARADVMTPRDRHRACRTHDNGGAGPSRRCTADARPGPGRPGLEGHRASDPRRPYLAGVRGRGRAGVSGSMTRVVGYHPRVVRDRLLLVVRAVTVVVVVAAIIAPAMALTDAGTLDATRFLAFFTIQSNLIGVAVFVLLIARRATPPGRRIDLLRGAAVVYLTVTFVVVIVLLGGVDVQLDFAWVDFVLHKLFPVVMIADWIIDPPATRLGLRDSIIWLIYPLVWTVLTVIRGAMDGWYPYPFLDPADSDYVRVLIVIMGISAAFLVFAALVIAIGNFRGQTRHATSIAEG